MTKISRKTQTKGHECAQGKENSLLLGVAGIVREGFLEEVARKLGLEVGLE